MLNYIQLVVELYKKELQQDRELLEGLIQEWILIPRDTTMYTYMAMYGVFGCIIKILVLLLLRIPVWWPMHILAYMINCIVRYSFVPLFGVLHNQLNKAEANKNNLAQQVYGYIYVIVEWLEWILKTVFLLTYIVDVIVTWVKNKRSLRGYIDHKIDQIFVKAHILRNEKQKQSKVRKLLSEGKQVWTTYISPIPRLIWQGIRIIIKYVNPFNYTWVKYVFYAKNRRNLIVIIKCRLIIRIAILQGLIKYGIQGWLWFKLCRLSRNIIHLFKVIGIKYHPRLALLNMSYWIAYHSWWITNVMYIHMCYMYIYIAGGLKWLFMCAAILSYPLLYVLLQFLYVIAVFRIWYTHGWWISRSHFYLMVGWNTNISFWKWHTRIK